MTTPTIPAHAPHRETGAPAPNSTIEHQLDHRTIRAFTAEPVPEAQIATLLDVARHTATSSFYQQATIIRVKDPRIRHEIYLSSGQPYVDGTRGELFVFVVDLYRNARIREEAGLDVEPLELTTLFLQAVEDTVLAAQNAVVAAESMGLGTVYLGSIVGDPRRVIRALCLPIRTFPLLGLLVGHPDQAPQLKPRLPACFTTGVDAYPRVEDYHAALAGYDRETQTYYEHRDSHRRIDSFTRRIHRKPGTGRSEQAPVLDVLHEQRLALR